VCCNDDSWELHIGDVVFMDEHTSPLRVYRIGYGDYEKEVRVAGLLEKTSNWTVGMWIRTDRLYKLEINDSLQVIADVVDATEKERLIKNGSVCTFRGWDDDGAVPEEHADQLPVAAVRPGAEHAGPGRRWDSFTAA